MYFIKNKNMVIQSCIFLAFLLVQLNAQCPTYSDLLNSGYIPGLNPHEPKEGLNLDEFGVVDESSFYVKVNNYPPVKAFEITKSCGTSYYFSFDTDEDYSQ